MFSELKLVEFQSPVGTLLLGSFNSQLVLADWKYRAMRNKIDQRIQSYFKAKYIYQNTSITENAILQLEEYFQGKRKKFTLPIEMAGTEFQKKVWEQLLQVAYGETCTYLQLSRMVGDEQSIRAVASANGANALSIFIPCHRIVGSGGDLVGYAGGLTAKKKLLHIEKGINQLEISF